MEIRIDVYFKNIHSNEQALTSSSVFNSKLTFGEVVSFLHTQMPNGIEAIDFKDDIPFIKINFFYKQRAEDFYQKLLNTFELKKVDDFGEFKTHYENDNFIVITDEGFTSKEIDELMSLLESNNFSANITQITQTISITEVGASGYFEDFLINLAAGFTQNGIEKLYNLLKGKGFNRGGIHKYNTSEAKKFIADNYSVKINSIRLTKARSLGDGIILFTFSTRFEDFVIKMNKNEEIIDFKIKKAKF